AVLSVRYSHCRAVSRLTYGQSGDVSLALIFYFPEKPRILLVILFPRHTVAVTALASRDFGPSTRTCAGHNFRPFGIDQQYRPLSGMFTTKTTEETRMDPTTTFCPHMACPARGQRGQGNIGIHSRQDKRFMCTECCKTCSATTGTAFYRLRTAAE